MQQTTTTIEQTYHLGNTIGKALHAGDVVLLSGEMGSAKTTLTKGILSHFDIHPNVVVSPTFSLMQMYDIEPQTRNIEQANITTIVHIDTYRLNTEQELIDIGITDYLGDSSTICIIEWPEKMTTLLQNKKTIHIHCESLDDTTRKITIDGLTIPDTI
jgi:tRNA threonylcarbamoyladenosine biosynthesis protein TsaE